ncbi:MAG TPA: GDP-L-fucose synthase [Phycisphaerae bacterium]|nr:GDP-L-fucose synthase [Phycisphaerae bacterium]
MADPQLWSDKRVCVTGGHGFLGRHLCRMLEERGSGEVFVPRVEDYDLTTPSAVARMYDDAGPDLVIHLAAEVGGIGANQRHPGRFFYANLAMGLHLIEEGRRRGLEKFVQVGTVCAYPKHCPVPFHEDDLWDGYPEETNAPYGIAKKALLVMLQAYRAEYGFNGIYLLPVNLYGPGDNFDLQSSHVIPALIRKFDWAAQTGAATVECWGTGSASREFLYVEDAADGILTAAEHYDGPLPINLGSGHEIRIEDLAELVGHLTGYTGRIEWDQTRPDGQPRRQLCTDRARDLLNWQATTDLETGLGKTIDWWRVHHPTTALAATT